MEPVSWLSDTFESAMPDSSTDTSTSPATPDVSTEPHAQPRSPPAPPPTARLWDVACGTTPRPQEKPERKKTAPEKREWGWPVDLSSTTIFGGTILLICAAMHSFTQMSIHVPPDTEMSLQLSAPNCTWYTEVWVKGNYFGCFSPRFTSQKLEPAPPPRRIRHSCDRAIWDDLYEHHRTANQPLDLSDARSLAADVSARTAESDSCGGAPSHRKASSPTTCFTHATSSKHLDHVATRTYVGCLLGHESEDCRESVCA